MLIFNLIFIFFRKRRLREEKNIQHAVARKLEARENKEKDLQSELDAEKERLIRKQRQVTGDYSSDDETPAQAQPKEEGNDEAGKEKNKKLVKKPPRKKAKTK